MNSKMWKVCSMREALFNAVAFLFLLCGITLGCTSTKNLEQEIRNHDTAQKSVPSSSSENTTALTATEEYGVHVHNRILSESDVNLPPKSVSGDSLLQGARMNGESEMSSKENVRKELGIRGFSEPKSAVADKIVDNYLNSDKKAPGGHCLSVSKTRFEKAYQAIYGRSVYKDLPDSMATTHYTPREVFDYLYVSASGTHEGWRSLPINYRGKGNAGAIAYAGMGNLVDWYGIWSGKLRPGALMQVWKRRNAYELVVQGISKKDFDAFGHSFIFMGYVHDEDNKIIGIKIADQGYQSYRPLLPNDYEVWWAVNLTI